MMAAAGYVLCPTASSAQDSSQFLEAIDIISTSPISGGEVPIEKVPTGVTTATSEDFDKLPTSTIQNVLQQNVPGAIVVDLQGSDYQNEIRFRGFAASPVNGIPQGLAVYQNGVRINESFGDIVNFDFLPDSAIDSIDIQSANPVFGLNALGGSVAIKMRDGFNFQGVEIDLKTGGYGHRSGSIAGGMLSESGNVAGFVAIEGIEDAGWRDFSEAEVKRIYADFGIKTQSGGEFHVNYTGADNSIGVVAASPVDILDVDWNRTFTSPQVTDKEVHMVSINGKVDLDDNWKASGLAYYRKFDLNILDGNLAEFEACEEDNDILDRNGNVLNPAPTEDTLTGIGPTEDFVCGEEEDDEQPLLYGANGQPLRVDAVLDDPDDGAFGSIDRITQDAESYGTTLQFVNKGSIFGFNNQFLVGGSYDHGEVTYTASSEPGEITERFVVEGSGETITEGGEFTPRRLKTENSYYGVYFSNVTDLTDKLALTLGGRYNYVEIDLTDLTGNFPDLNANRTFERFNPMVGATYQVTPGLTFYGSYAEANRAPTAAELGCSDASAPCPVESFLTDDPPLDQVVSKSYEAGIRGKYDNVFGGSNALDFSIGYFHSTNEDDILSIASPEQGRGYFQNKSDTRREGIEAAVKYAADRWKMYANYSYTKATYLDSFYVPATGNPNALPVGQCPDEIDGVDADDIECLLVSPGDRMPGIPEHIFKAGIDFNVTPQWLVGADIIVTSDQVFFGDEANVAAKLAGYEKVDLRTTYDVTDKLQIYGSIENVFDKKYGLFGNFFQIEEPDEVAEAAGYDFLPDAGTSIVPSKPVTAYVGVKIKLD